MVRRKSKVFGADERVVFSRRERRANEMAPDWEILGERDQMYGVKEIKN